MADKRIRLDILTIIVNVTTAVIIGVFIDRFFTFIKTYIGLYARILLQLTVTIIAVYIFNYFYTSLDISNLLHGIYFLSIFLGVQQSLFVDITKI